MDNQLKNNMNSDEVNKSTFKLINQLLVLNVLLILIIIVFAIYFLLANNSNTNTENLPSEESVVALNNTTESKPVENFWTAPSIEEIIDTEQKKLIEYGKEIIAHTSVYFGAKGKVNANSTNGMNCQNCHLDAGTKVFGNNYSAVASTYPKFRARSGSTENIYKRVNDCFERSLNGKGLDTTSKEMQAIVAYINFLGKDVAKGEKPKGVGFKDLAFLDRAIDPVKGKVVYDQKCVSCHQTTGEGLLTDDKTAFVYPPLWGKNSYNDGAGLYRMSNFAKYVKYNMPLGVNHENTQLTDEEAWDVAAFVNSQSRPKKNIKKDWPNIAEKPFDHPFGPYADGFTEKEHKYGPYKPIKAKLEQLKKSSTQTPKNT